MIEVYSEVVPMTIVTDQGHPGFASTQRTFGNQYGWCCYGCGEQHVYHSLVGADRAADAHTCRETK